MADALIRIVRDSVSILEKFDPSQPTTLGEFSTEYLKNGDEIIRPDHQEAVIRVCEGCLKQREVLRAIVRSFCQQSKRTILRRDSRLFEVLAYILLFLTKTYSSAVIQSILSRLYSFSVRRFLLFFSGLNDDVEKTKRPMHSLVKTKWYANFDRAHVDEQFYHPFCAYEDEFRRIVAVLEAAYRNETGKQTVRKPRTTVFKPFDFKTSERKILSEARLQFCQTPLKEKKRKNPKFSVKAIPSTTYAPSDDTIRMQVKARERRTKSETLKIRINHRNLVRQRILQANDENFSAKKIVRFLAQIRQKEMDEMESPVTSSDMVPKNPEAKMRKKRSGTPLEPVKQTTAALLREKALFQKNKEIFQKKTEELAAGYWDPQKFEDRFRRLEEKDLEAAIVENERKIIDAMQSLEKAIAAKKAFDQEIKLKTLSEKEVKKGVREQRRVEMEEEISDLRAAVEQAQLVSKAQLGEAKRRLLFHKQKKASLVKEENNQLYHRYLDQCQEELLRRKAVITQIQEMEARISIFEKTFDFGKVRKYGNLTDLSLADLQDRLISLRFDMIEKQTQKREKILDEKQVSRQSLSEAKAFVDNERPQWEEKKRISAEKARKTKNLQQGISNLPNVTAVRNLLLQQSQERRKQRVSKRESLLKIHDSAWKEYFFV